MRIIGGNLKGKKIFLPKDKNTRPLRDMVKESIFNLIEHSNKFYCSIINSNVLDLFSGSGSFGLECISRGAKKVTFVENYNNALLILKKNINYFSVNKNSKIIMESCFKIFGSNNKFENKFDIIFIDPPYKEVKVNEIIEYIKKEKILNNNGIIILHRHKKDTVVISNKLKILDERIYGVSKITYGN